ncbi:MAG: mechanosensitive ion channel family protein [Candidatus Aenigmatarchaeota archaeon]
MVENIKNKNGPKVYLKNFVLIFIIILLFIATEFSFNYLFNSEVYKEYSKYAFIVFVSVIWIFASRVIAEFLYRRSKVENEKLALKIRTLVHYVSIFFLILFILYQIGVDPSLLIASGAFGGLIIGLAAQPILQNFFAGLIILGGRIIEPGDEIRIVTPQIPYQTIFLPPYKVFSRDFLHIGYRGTVIEVGIFYSKILLESGELLIVQNYTILSSGIINYTKSTSDENVYKKLKIRFEFDQRVQPEEVFRFLKKILKNKGDLEYYIEEVSDKGYYIVCIEGKIDENKYKYIKSDILKKLIEFNSKKIDEIKEREKMIEIKVKEKLEANATKTTPTDEIKGKDVVEDTSTENQK